MFSKKIETTNKEHKELKSARDPNVGPPDLPGSRVHCHICISCKRDNTFLITFLI